MKKIKKIKNGFFSRSLGFTKLALKTGKNFYLDQNNPLKTRIRSGFEEHLEEIVSELGVMKGSLMKAGQMLATYGQAVLPPEAQKILKSLENQSYFLDWEQIQADIPREWLQQLRIEHNPIAAASMGQVHMAYEQENIYAMKIQYRGVKKAIKNDIRALKFLLRSLKLIPKELNLDELYIEVEQMMHQETDYLMEAQHTRTMREYLKNYPQYLVPKIITQYSNERILTTEFLKGHSLHDLENLDLSQEHRNHLGRELMRLLFLEIFKFNLIQTDVHFGNFVILIDQEMPRWGLIDYGASKEAPEDFIQAYQKLIIALAQKDQNSFFNQLYEMGYLSKTKATDQEFFWEYALLVGAPFQTDTYDWGESQIADQVLEYIPQIFKKVSLGKVPRHTLFIDRKIGGIYFILQKLKAKFNVKELIDEFI